MAAKENKVPVSKEGSEAGPTQPRGWHALEGLRQEIDRLFDEFPSWRSPPRRSLFGADPFWRTGWTGGAAPAVDIVEKDKAYEISAELPGMDEKNIEVKYADGMLTIKGEKEESKEEKEKDYHLSERRYGSFQRTFSVPEGVDADKVAATFTKRVLTVTLPKSAEAQKKEKEIAVTVK